MYYLIDQMAVGRLTAAPALSNEEPFQCTRQCIDCTDVCNTSKVGRSRDAGVLSCPKRREVRFEIRASSRAGQTGKIPHLSLRRLASTYLLFRVSSPRPPKRCSRRQGDAGSLWADTRFGCLDGKRCANPRFDLDAHFDGAGADTQNGGVQGKWRTLPRLKR